MRRRAGRRLSLYRRGLTASGPATAVATGPTGPVARPTAWRGSPAGASRRGSPRPAARSWPRSSRSGT
ncbi:hypothetical protein FA014_19180 [Cellulomonas hominis]|uniref:Uncharacterized protein n=1 Tax=Cellulomonas hominis TaxID=156981 RepID=A0A7Z8JW46_9CELL|nr:hypothetical protein FA014_19180 [Cellulomonas hominis]